jgi:hypothetical protein
MFSLRPILRDARLWRGPQDEVLFRGEILDPHGEERRLRRVSNHEAEYAIGLHLHEDATCRMCIVGPRHFRQNITNWKVPRCVRLREGGHCANRPLSHLVRKGVSNVA